MEIFLINKTKLIKNRYFIKFIEELKDEIIVFIEKKNKNFFIYMSTFWGGNLF
jgi:DNA-dependent RNA polymerase auxiliary subunit epsilon